MTYNNDPKNTNASKHDTCGYSRVVNSVSSMSSVVSESSVSFTLVGWKNVNNGMTKRLDMDFRTFPAIVRILDGAHKINAMCGMSDDVTCEGRDDGVKFIEHTSVPKAICNVN